MHNFHETLQARSAGDNIFASLEAITGVSDLSRATNGRWVSWDAFKEKP